MRQLRTPRPSALSTGGKILLGDLDSRAPPSDAWLREALWKAQLEEVEEVEAEEEVEEVEERQIAAPRTVGNLDFDSWMLGQALREGNLDFQMSHLEEYDALPANHPSRRVLPHQEMDPKFAYMRFPKVTVPKDTPLVFGGSYPIDEPLAPRALGTGQREGQRRAVGHSGTFPVEEVCCRPEAQCAEHEELSRRTALALATQRSLEDAAALAQREMDTAQVWADEEMDRVRRYADELLDSAEAATRAETSRVADIPDYANLMDEHPSYSQGHRLLQEEREEEEPTFDLQEDGGRGSWEEESSFNYDKEHSSGAFNASASVPIYPVDRSLEDGQRYRESDCDEDIEEAAEEEEEYSEHDDFYLQEDEEERERGYSLRHRNVQQFQQRSPRREGQFYEQSPATGYFLQPTSKVPSTGPTAASHSPATPYGAPTSPLGSPPSGPVRPSSLQGASARSQVLPRMQHRQQP